MLQLGAKPGQEDGPAPASGKTLVSREPKMASFGEKYCHAARAAHQGRVSVRKGKRGFAFRVNAVKPMLALCASSQDPRLRG